MKRFWHGLLLACLVAGGNVWNATADIDWGPLLSREQSRDGVVRWRALGPLLEFRRGNEFGDDFSAVRPLFSRVDDAHMHQTVQDVLWPLWMGKLRDQRSAQWRLLLLMSWRNDDIQDPDSRYAFHVLPLYFHGRNADGEFYLAVFPIGGRIMHFLFYDEVRFVLFPLYSHARVNQQETVSWLWPLLSQTQGGDCERRRFFPFYGYSRRRDDFEKSFIMWPFWTSAVYNYPGSSGSGFVFFPFFGRVSLEDQSSWMVLPPFFRVSRGEKLSQTHMPWPFIQMSSGDVEQLYFWPLWGRKTATGQRHDFILWPFGMRYRHFSPHASRERLWLLPFVYCADDSQTLPAPARRSSARKIWPLFTMHTQDDHSRLHAPTLLPFRDFPAIDRNFAPLWTLYTRETSTQTVAHEALWGLWRQRRHIDGSCYFSLFPLAQYRRETGSDTREWNFLKGLAGYARTGGRRRLRLLYFLRFNIGAAPESE